ncbi:MAG: hypothetical protein AAGG99_05560 [Pseudomonadota bacterium]
MGRIILDECVPHRLRLELAGHDVATAHYAGLEGLRDGALLDRLAGRCDAFLAVDRSLIHQNVLINRSFVVIVLRSPSNSREALRPMIPRVLEALETAKPGDVIEIHSA